MGHGKETPRQKMIGMMYLVLTALLALNVQKEVLNAFVIVDEGIVKMNENYAVKNEKMYDAFELAVIEKPKKAKKYRDIAIEVKKQSNEIYEMANDLKLKIVGIGEKGNKEAITGKEIQPGKISGKEDMNIPGQVMIVEKSGAKLKHAIESYKEFLLKNIDPKAENIRNTISKGLNTEDPPAQDGKLESWESEHFEHLPLVGVTTVLSGLQSSIRNAESDMLRYLFTMIDKGTFKFTSLEATVIHNSNYIIQGNEYQAKIFLAAFDTSQNPSIYIGPLDSIKNDDGTYDYKKKAGVNYDSLPVKNGKGNYIRKAGGVGPVKLTGIIMLRAPDGGVPIYKPFKSEYQVVEPMLVVSPTKMNVFYTGVENPVEISVPGVPSDKISASINNGTIKPIGKGAFIVMPTRIGQLAQVNVIAEIEKGKKRNMGTKDFRVKMVPDPIAKVAGIKNSGSIEKNLLLAQFGVVAEMENFDFDLKFKVTEFSVSTIVGGFTSDKPSKSNKFTVEQMALIKQATKNQRVYIESVKAVGPDGSIRTLGNISLTIK